MTDWNSQPADNANYSKISVENLKTSAGKPWKRRTGQSLRLQNNALLCHRCGITCHSGLAAREM